MSKTVLTITGEKTETQVTVQVTKRFTFESCHHLPSHQGACRNRHGHSYKLFVTISGPIHPVDIEDPASGMVMDFKELKNIVNRWVDTYDHTDLNDFFAVPTAEVMACLLFQKIQDELPSPVELVKVRLFETEDSYVDVVNELFNGQEE